MGNVEWSGGNTGYAKLAKGERTEGNWEFGYGIMGKIGMSWVGRGLSKWGRQVLGEPEQGRFLLVDF